MEEIYTCEYCKIFTTTNSGMWGKHKQNCWANPNSYREIRTDWYCKICDIRFLRRKEKEEHNSANHMTNKEQECSYCYKKWITTDLYKIKHEKKCRNNPNKIIQIKCSYCNRNFNSQELTNEHELICHKNPIHYEKDYNFTSVNDNNPSNIGVYKIVSPSGKVYIGMTATSFKERWNSHRKELKASKHRCRGLQFAFNKYGWEQLDKVIIEEYIKPVEISEQINLGNYILLREQELWDEYNANGSIIYNARPTASGSVNHNEETRDKIAFATYFNHQSYCKIWFRECLICDILFTTNIGGRKICNEQSCFEKYEKLSIDNKLRKLKRTKKKPISKYKNSKICKYDKCCNFIVGKNSYCSKDCEKLKKNEYYIYIPKDELYDYYINQLWSTTEIAEKYNSNHTNVQNKLKEYGIPLRNRTEGLHAKNVRVVKKNVDKDSLVKLLQRGVSKQYIYETLDITPKILKNAIEYYKLEDYLKKEITPQP